MTWLACSSPTLVSYVWNRRRGLVISIYNIRWWKWWLGWRALVPLSSHTSETTDIYMYSRTPHQRPSLSYDHISCDGQWFLFVYESLTSDHPSYTTTPMWFWGWSYKRGSTVYLILYILGGCPFHGRVERDEIPTRESPPKQSGTRWTE